jgi:formate hydrogenlyase transcriptional activator
MVRATALATEHLSRYDALLSLSSTLAGHTSMAELFKVLADRLHSIVPFDYLALVLHDDATDEMRLVVLEPADVIVPFTSKPVADQGPAATVWTKQKRAVIPIPPDGPLPPALEFIRSQGRRMSCWLPLTTAHRRIGVLGFGSRSEAPYSEDVLAFMEQLAAVIAIAVENGINYEQARRYERELREERDELRFLLDINNLLVTQLQYRLLFKAICEAVQRVVAADQIGIILYDADAEVLRLEGRYDNAQGFSKFETTLSLDRSVAGLTFQRGVAGVFRRSEVKECGLDDCAAVMKAAGVESICCIPLVTRNGKLGVLYVGSTRPDVFSDSDVTLLGHASTQIAIAVENARAYEQIVQSNAQLTDEKHYLEEELQHEFTDIVGTSHTLRRALRAVKTVAPTDSTVLLLGETGTGKELIARALHHHSPRRGRSFVRMNAAALPAGLLESELFGHEKGAFTGAMVSRMGRLELANRGTLFLDEVGDIPMEVQPKLLRVLQEREFERLGSTRTQQVDVRVVAATNRDLEHMVEQGSFRSDLFYRLNVFPIAIPPLRERIEDIPALARHFAQHCARRLGRPVPSIPAAVIDTLTGWSWPGNIRELQNVIERAVIVSTGSTLALSPEDVQPQMRRGASGSKPAATFEDAERDAILRALRASGGIIAGPTGAAARLGLRRTTLQSKMRRLHIQRPSY